MSADTREEKLAKVIPLFGNRVDDAIKAREEFLENLPPEKRERYLEMQKKIDLALDDQDSQDSRLELIAKLMVASLNNLNSAVSNLKEQVVNAES